MGVSAGAQVRVRWVRAVADVGRHRRHALIQTNLATALATRLRGSRCVFLGIDVKLVTSNRCRHPDGQVSCGPADDAATFNTTPTVVVEVVSKSSAETDHVDKLADYQALESVRHYVLVEQDRAMATVHRREGDGWVRDSVEAGGMVALPAIGQSVPLA